jgi:hypothetical protein
MIGFFPDPYPDELLYSSCARYAERVKYANKKFAKEEIFGGTGFSSIVDFPTRLQSLLESLADNNYSVGEFINKNTLLPFFEPFLPDGRAKIVKREIASSDRNSIAARLGIKAKQIRRPDYLRFCPLCTENDRQMYGETYWHREHQLTGIPICPKHLCFLENSLLLRGRESSRAFQTAEELIVPAEPHYINPENKNHQILLKLAKDAEWLLLQENLYLGAEVLRQRYFNLLLKRGFAYYNGNLKHKKFIQACDDYFSPELFKMVGRLSRRDYWLSDLIRSNKIGVTFHPIRHLLLMTFLGLTAKEFFTSFVEYKPFNEPPYPCLNKAAEHYRELRIKECQIFDNLSKEDNKKGRPLAVFHCDCGFIYQRIGPDNSEEDRFTYSLVREYGHVWENEFTGLWADLSISNTEIGRRLGIDQTSVSRQAIRLNLPRNTEDTRSLQGYLRHQNPNKRFSQMRQNHRDQWLEVIKNNPGSTRGELAHPNIFLYLWLRRNDRDWHEQHLPPVSKPAKKGEILDWKKIDEELSEKVENVCDGIMTIKTFPVRVSTTEIIRRAGNQTWIEKRERKLPLTTKIINERLESLEDYMIRKAQWAKEEFLKEKKLPTKEQLKMKAGVKNKTSNESEKVQRVIDAAFEELHAKL